MVFEILKNNILNALEGMTPSTIFIFREKGGAISMNDCNTYIANILEGYDSDWITKLTIPDQGFEADFRNKAWTIVKSKSKFNKRKPWDNVYVEDLSGKKIRVGDSFIKTMNDTSRVKCIDNVYWDYSGINVYKDEKGFYTTPAQFDKPDIFSKINEIFKMLDMKKVPSPFGHSVCEQSATSNSLSLTILLNYLTSDTASELLKIRDDIKKSGQSITFKLWLNDEERTASDFLVIPRYPNYAISSHATSINNVKLLNIEKREIYSLRY